MKLTTILVGLVLLSGCASMSLPERLIGANEAITSSVRVTTIALQQDRISPQAACRVSAYAKVAGRAVDEAWEHWAMGQPETASQKLGAASAALNGTSQAAIAAAGACE